MTNLAPICDEFPSYQVCSADLLAVLSRHFQPVTCLCFSDDGARFVSASRDGQVLAWDLADAAGAGSTEPLHAWTQHSHDVTDLHIGQGGDLARIYSVSLDQTLRAYALDTGEVLATAVLDAALAAVAVDPDEGSAFAGASSGKIFQASSTSVVLGGCVCSRGCKWPSESGQGLLYTLCLSVSSRGAVFFLPLFLHSPPLPRHLRGARGRCLARTIARSRAHR